MSNILVVGEGLKLTGAQVELDERLRDVPAFLDRLRKLNGTGGIPITELTTMRQSAADLLDLDKRLRGEPSSDRFAASTLSVDDSYVEAARDVIRIIDAAMTDYTIPLP